jgi:hypothetical protein
LKSTVSGTSTPILRLAGDDRVGSVGSVVRAERVASVGSVANNAELPKPSESEPAGTVV